MVKGCSVRGCTKRSNGKGRETGVKFFKFPMDRHKRRSWIKALNRKDWEPTANSFLCLDHFVSGWHAYDRPELDYTPTVFHYKQKATNLAFKCNLSKTFEEAAQIQKEQEEGMLRQSMAQHDYVISTDTDNTECTDKSYSTTGMQSEWDPVLEENILQTAVD
ncbi:THAP domain-containing protein 2-like [Argopecten irradians]|uniref:THAP domain-containing protein 2-like n=1 Tax=Argopecten irradians TaxID=31199 RepID=UPI003719C000